MASYRDPELLQTVTSAYDNADKPDDLVFGIYSQVAEGEHPNLSAYPTREVVVPYTEAKGAGYARAEVQKLYQDEQWYLQVDAHTLFEPHWDTRLIAWHEEICDEWGIISGWAAPYCYKDNEIVLAHEDGAWEWFPHTTEARSYKTSWIGARVPMEANYQEMQVLLAGFIFAPGHFVKEVPYDPRICFWAEELLLSARAYSAGYEMYSVNEIILRHNYVRHGTVRAWDDIPTWDQMSKDALKIQRDVLTLRESGPYGIKHIPFYLEWLSKMDKLSLPYRCERMYQQSLKA